MSELARAIDRSASEYIARVLSQVRAAEAAGFIPLASDDELESRWPKAYHGSRLSIGKRLAPQRPTLFRDGAHPWADGLTVKRSYHAGGKERWDFIRHDYNVNGLTVTVLDGVNEALVRLPGRGRALPSLSPAARSAEITKIAASLFATPWSGATWTPRGAAGDIAFTTAPLALPTDSPAARQRMDALVIGADLHFIFYKLHTDERSKRMVNPSSWFAGNR